MEDGEDDEENNLDDATEGKEAWSKVSIEKLLIISLSLLQSSSPSHMKSRKVDLVSRNERTQVVVIST